MTSKKSSRRLPGEETNETSFGALHVLLGLIVSAIPALVAGLMIASNPGTEILDYTP
jgi:hypothetical protein